MPTFENLDVEYLAALDVLLESEGIAAARPAKVERGSGSPRMSAAQRRMWFLSQLDPASPAYNISAAVRLRGDFRPALLSDCLDEIVRRHEVLRTTFHETPDGSKPRVHEFVKVPVVSLDLSSWPIVERDLRARAFTASQAAIPFDLAIAPLLRVGIARLAETEHVAVLVMHHIISDGWSMGVLVRELSELNAAFSANLPSPLAELPIQYSDFAEWQHQQKFDLQLEYWRRHLAGAPQFFLPTDRARPPAPCFSGAVEPFHVGSARLDALSKFADVERATLFTALLAVFQILLSRYTRQTDIIVGVPSTGRGRKEFESLIGFFVNPLALRSRWPRGASFREVLQHTRRVVLQALENQDVPFDDVVRAILPGRDLNHNPLFQVMFNVEMESDAPLELTNTVATTEAVQTGNSKFDLSLHLTPSVDGLWGGFEYRTDLFDKSTIARMAGHFAQLLEAVTEQPDMPVAHLPILTAVERHQLLQYSNETSPPSARIEQSPVALFAEQAAANGDAIALELAGKEWSYRELDRLSSAWASELRQRGVGIEDRVAVCMEISYEMVVAVVAVVKAGAAYVPINPSDPEARVDFILSETRATALLTQRHLVERLSAFRVPLIQLDVEEPGSWNKQLPSVGPDQLAYVMYTSGSTGEPKGIAITHRAIVRLVRDTNYIGLRNDDRMAMASNFAFDAATFEIWGALLNGARLVAVQRDVALSPERLARLLRERDVTTLFLTTALFNQIVRDLPGAFSSLRHLLFGGEAVDVDVVRLLCANGSPSRLLHVYGPTETTTFATWFEVRDVESADCTIPIGRPLTQTQTYVVDGDFELVPLGVPGELCLGGAGLTRGYINRPDLTACALVPDPFSGERGARLYRTGDLVRWLPGGELEFLGRIDDQVKIRGYRIEPSEIAATLNRHQNVKESVVVVREDQLGRRGLAAYVVTTQNSHFSAAVLRNYLASKLPDYMLPTAFLELAFLPMNANGKIDRKALPPIPEVTDDAADEAPRDDRERAVLEAWEKALHRDQIGIRRNYFEIGGDSITAIQIVSNLKRAGWLIQARDIFQHPSVERLALRLQPVSRAVESERKTLEPSSPLTPVQRFFFQSFRGPLHHFNQSVMLKSHEPLESASIRKVLEALWGRHDALRTVFQDCATGDGRQIVGGVSPDCSVIDLRGKTDLRLEKYADTLQSGFDLSRGPLLRAMLFHCDDADRLLLVAHHLVIDGVSLRILIEELQMAIGQLAVGKTIDLGPPPNSWQQWSFALEERARSSDLQSERDYWSKLVSEAAADRLPRDGDTETNEFGEAQIEGFQLSCEETRALLENAGGAFHTEVNDLLLAGLAQALAEWRAVRSTTITLESHGRNALDLDVSGTVGWFTSLFPFRLLYVSDSLRGQVIAVKHALRAIERDGAGYGLLRYGASDGGDGLSLETALSFNYLGQFEVAQTGGRWELASEGMGASIAARLSRPHDLDLTAIVLAGSLNVSIMFHPRRHRSESVRDLLALYRRELLRISRYCCEHEPEKTTSDFSLDGLSQAAWDEIRERHGWAAGEIEDVLPLSPMQEGLQFQGLYDRESRAYHIQAAFEVEGSLDSCALAKAWDDLTQRHSALRSAFVHEGVERPLQVVLRSRANPFTDLDLAELPPSKQISELEQWRAADLARGFDLASEPLSRLTVFRLGPRSAHLLWSCHHVIVDGWSMAVLWAELVELYQARIADIPAALPPAPAYAEYLRWIESQDEAVSTAYWASQLRDLEGVARVPSTGVPVPGAVAKAAEFVSEFDAALTTRLRALAVREGVTLNHLIQAIWALLLAKYNGTRDVSFGIVVSGRPPDLAHVERTIGLFINTVPLRTPVLPQMTFVELVQRIRKTTLEAEQHHWLPLAKVQALSSFWSGIINHLLIFENYPANVVEIDAPGAESLSLRPVYGHDETHYDFTLVVTPGEALHLRFSFNSALYAEDDIARIATHLRTVAQAVSDSPWRSIREIDILSTAERHKAVIEFNRSAVKIDFAQTIGERIAAVAARMPGEIAVRFGKEEVTYGELDARAAAIAAALFRRGVAVGDRVGVLLERSPGLVASLLGTWKAGATYVPVDPHDRQERIQHILSDSRCSAVLATSELQGSIALPKDCRWIDPHLLTEASEPRGSCPQEGADGAYVIYTSGSTGLPKGCEITHRNLINYLDWASCAFHGDGVPGNYGLFTSVAFDLTVTSLFTPLLLGRTLHIFAQDAELPDILRAVFDGSCGIDSVKCTPTHLSLLGQLDLTASPVQLCIVGGEALSASHVACLRQLNSAMRIWNEYGPTETTVGCVATPIHPNAQRILIGRPIANVEAYIFDRDGHPAPIGVPGEICIGGEGVGTGYLFRPDLTAEKFIPDVDRPGKRLYRTGDIGRWLPDGTIDYLGRNDEQVKIRGHRVELAEVQHALLGLPGVRDAVVLAREQDGDQELIAYVVGSTDAGSLRRGCRDILPAHLVPAHIILLDHLPLTDSGKLDKNRLPKPIDLEFVNCQSVETATPTEAALLRIWRSIFGNREISLRDNFFELGGHSLRAIQALSRIHRELGRKVALRDFFRHPTIEELARLIAEQPRDAWSRIPSAPLQETYELSNAQKRLWLTDRMGAARSLNTQNIVAYVGWIDVAALERALSALVERHESLRTAFVVINGMPRQKVCPARQIRVRKIDLQSEPDSELRARTIAREEAMQAFDLSQPLLFRVTLIELNGDRRLFIITMHHIVGDAWSQQVFFEELAQLYTAFLRRFSNPLPSLPVQYKDYAAWQNSRNFCVEETYWSERLRGVPEGVALPFDFLPGTSREFLGAAEELRLTPELTCAVRETARQHGTLPSYVLLTFFVLVLYRYSRQTDLCIGMSCANRNRPELERLIGFFVNILPIRMQLSDSMDFTELMQQIVTVATEALDHQDYPLDLLIQKLNPPRRSNRPPLINAVFGFHDFLDIRLEGSGDPIAEENLPKWIPELTGEPTDSHETAKFDLSLLVTDCVTHFDLWLEYDRTLFRAETARHYLALLEKLAHSVTQSAASESSAQQYSSPYADETC
jgi:amino acid adenylation domain-containing protein/non-ribosomal peptide synthase protein (TIGR01720 family)